MEVTAKIYAEKIRECAPYNYDYNESAKNILNQLFFWISGQDIISTNPFTRSTQMGSWKKGFYIAGATGVGKTTLMKLFIKAVDRLNVKEETVTGYSARLAPRFISVKSLSRDFVKRGYEALTINAYSILLDDVGSEQLDCVHMGNRVNVVDEIITNIYERNYGYLFITSNYPLGSAEFSERYGDRLQSRICELCNYLELKGNDYRIRE